MTPTTTVFNIMTNRTSSSLVRTETGNIKWTVSNNGGILVYNKYVKADRRMLYFQNLKIILVLIGFHPEARKANVTILCWYGEKLRWSELKKLEVITKRCKFHSLFDCNSLLT